MQKKKKHTGKQPTFIPDKSFCDLEVKKNILNLINSNNEIW